MAKKILSAIIIFSFAMTFLTTSACCKDDATTKLGRGIANMLTWPLEIPEQITRVNNSDGPVAASTVGVLKGVAWAVGRACIGVFETATFLMPYPKDYKPILRDPEFFLENTSF